MSKLDTFTEPPTLLKTQRENVSFPIRKLTYYIDGGEAETRVSEELMRAFERDPAFQHDDQYDLTYEQQREVTFDRVAALVKQILENMDETEAHHRFSLVNLLDASTGTRAGVSLGLFLGTIRGSGTDSQVSYWLSKGCGELRRFAGCFAMTELGHGSATDQLETTAEWDPITDEFVINTPNTAATKWWIGGAAHTATHSVVYARLVVKGKDYGVKMFVVQLRNVHDHSLKVGITVGDIGKKMGRDGVDNGYIQFTNVRIPRQFMLMKWTKVDAQGNVTLPPLNQLSYGALVSARVQMAIDSVQTAKRFLTIAIRYAAVRRQFSSTPGQPETLLLDYTYHQRRLIPRLAYTFAMQAGASILYKFSQATNKKLAQVNTKDKAAVDAAISDAKELFSISAGMKAFGTWATAEIIDQCRQACGGHGYSGYNGFGQGYNDWVVQCTWEGDNNVLTLSAGRALILSAKAAREGKPVGKGISYINHAAELKTKRLGGRDICDPDVLVEAWESASARVITSAVDAYLALLDKGYNVAQAMEELSQQRFQCARIHTRLFIIRAFFQAVKDADSEIQPVLTKLATVFALWSIENDASLFLASEYLEAKDLDVVTSHVTDLNRKIRADAIGITDAFNLPDFFINAPIGNYDGNVYENYFEKVKRRNPIRNSKAPYHDTKIHPFLHRPEDEQVDVSELEDE